MGRIVESMAIDVGNIISRKGEGAIQLLTLAGNVEKIINSSILVKMNVFKSEFTAKIIVGISAQS